MPKSARPALLTEKVADTLRADLRQGKWHGHLPGERYLCETLHVSRNTLRRALAILQREGLIESAPGKPTRIAARPKRASKEVKTKVVGFLSGDQAEALTPAVVFCINELRRHMGSAGYQLMTHLVPHFDQHNPDRSLRSILHSTPAACWVLFACDRQVQRWFAQNRIPAVVGGHCFPGNRFPSVDFEGEAAVRHAVGEFLRCGHRRIAFVKPKSVLAGHFASEQGFLDGFHIQGYPDAVPIVANHDSTVSGLQRAVDSLLSSPKKPTGFLVGYARHCLTVFSHLLNQGLRFPRDVSLVASDDDVFFADLVPGITHYKLDHALYARRLARLLIKLANTGYLTPHATRIMPRFQPGETLGPPPSARV